MSRKKSHKMLPICENQDAIQSSGDGVATEGEEEEEETEIAFLRNSMRKNDQEHEEASHSTSEDTSEGNEQLTPYVAKCYRHLETLRKRKREQEEQVEMLVEEAFGQIEAIMQEIMRGFQESHATSHEQFEATDMKLSRSLREHNRMEKKLKMIAAILLREDDNNKEELDVRMAIGKVNTVDDNANVHVGNERDYAEVSVDVNAFDKEHGEASLGADGQEEENDYDDGTAAIQTVDKEELLEEVVDRFEDEAVELAGMNDDSVYDQRSRDEETATGAKRNPLVKGSLPSNKSFDHQVKAMVTSNNTISYIYFNQWKRKMNGKSTVTRLRLAFEQLLPRLLGGRDYVGATKVLGVIYHRFTLTPALCIEASLEIIRRQSDYRNELLSLYEAALEVHNQHIDKMAILKELWLFYVVHGEFYEAYNMYRDKIEQMKEAAEDVRLLANFGILCYWLMFIESRELRERFAWKDTDEEDAEEDEDGLDASICNNFGASESIESVIESKYLFKTPIGVHVLYQQACNALRRAMALNPNSAMFVEYYVQLLVMVGDIQAACDYLEAFFHSNPADPHGPKMLARFLERYYPESVDDQIAVFSRWMKTDPSCCYALEKMLELSSAGAVSSFRLTKFLIEALDTCGSDLYVIQNSDMALALWRNLAELLVAMDEDEFLMDQAEKGAAEPQETVADVGVKHAWWKRVYLARPSTVQEVVALAERGSIFMEVSIYRAVVSHRLFPGQLFMAEALRTAMTSPNVSLSHKHVRLFESFFPAILSTTTHVVARTLFSDMAFMVVGEDTKKKELPVFRGSADTVHVMERRSIVEREAASDQTRVIVTRAGTTEEVDQQFLDELYEALTSEVGLSNMNDRWSQRKRKADAISASSAPVLIPGFVAMVEEEVYNNPQATGQHIYSGIYQKLRRSDMLVPTSKVVAHCVNFFRSRLEKNIQTYGHAGLMMRYDDYIVMYVRRQRSKGTFEVTKDAAKAAVEEMKRVLPSSHPQFPGVNVVEHAMHIKVAMFVRQRRLRLMDLKQMLKPILKKLVYMDEKTFVDAVYSVCIRNGLLGVVTRNDVARTVQNVLPLHYYRVLQAIPARSTRLLTSPEFRKDCNTLEAILKKLKQANSPRTAEEVKALLWVERYEALYGPIIDDDEEESVEASDSDTCNSSNSCDSSTDIDESSTESDNVSYRRCYSEDENNRSDS